MGEAAALNYGSAVTISTGATDADVYASTVALRAIAAQKQADLAALASASTDVITTKSGVTRTAAQIAADIAAIDAAIAAMAGTAGSDATKATTTVTSRILLDVNASAETESGVTYGAMVRVRQTNGGTNAFNAARFYAKTGGLEVGLGNIYGAMDSMPGAYGQAVGLTGLSYSGLVTNSAMTFSSTGAGAAGTTKAVEAMYSMGDFSTHVSANGTDTEGFVAYSLNGWTVAAATSNSKTATSTQSAMTLSGKIGDVTLGLATAKTKGGSKQSTVSGKFSVGAATTVNAYYNTNDAATLLDKKSYGVGFAHDLGGATLKGGVEKTNKQTLADFGVVFNF